MDYTCSASLWAGGRGGHLCKYARAQEQKNAAGAVTPLHLATVFGLSAPPDVGDLAAQAADYLSPPLDPEELELLRTNLDESDLVATQAILALVQPEAACPGCVRDADAGLIWPTGATTRSCGFHALEYERQRTRCHPTCRKGAARGGSQHQRAGLGHVAQEISGISARTPRAWQWTGLRRAGCQGCHLGGNPIPRPWSREFAAEDIPRSALQTLVTYLNTQQQQGEQTTCAPPHQQPRLTRPADGNNSRHSTASLAPYAPTGSANGRRASPSTNPVCPGTSTR